ncbi:MAG: hypothetical protein WCJ55_13140 [Chloroflexales bacterium]
MVADNTALILALPDDTVESLLRKAEQAGARRVQLLVPEGVPGLQQQAQLERLRALADHDGIELTLISSDPQTLRAARLCQFETMQVRDAHVMAPPQVPAAPPPASPYATRVLGREEADDSRASRQAVDLSASDAAFLDALDDFDALPPVRASGPAASDEDFFAALESISADRDDRPPHRASTADDDFLAALDSLDVDEEELRRPAPRRADAPPAAPPRIRPEDIELSDAEKARAKQTGRQTSVPSRPVRTMTGSMSAHDTPAHERSPRNAERQATPHRRSWLVPVAITIVVLLILAAAASLVLGGRAAVIVAPPARPDQVKPISAMPIPLAAPGSSAGTAAQAEAINSDVAVTVSGQVAERTISPSGTARGTIAIISLSPQPITLPAGSEFIAVKADGQTVPFVSGGDVVVPPSITSDQGAQIVTTKGTARIEVVARSAGSASNVDANSIRRIVIPGGQTFNVETGALVVRHDPISGGSEDEVRIVKDSDVQRMLGEGLTKLDSQAREQLQALAHTRSLQVEATTISPRHADLTQRQGFEYTVSPAVGETVDPANPAFTLTIQARYSALATPPSTPLTGQLGAALTEQLRQAGLLQPGDCRAPVITSWAWDGTRLTVNGQIAPNTQSAACGPGLSAATLQQVRDAVRGKTRAQAEAALQTLQQQGVIGTYVLPDGEKLPDWDFQLRIEAQ